MRVWGRERGLLILGECKHNYLMVRRKMKKKKLVANVIFVGEIMCTAIVTMN